MTNSDDDLHATATAAEQVVARLDSYSQEDHVAQVAAARGRVEARERAYSGKADAASSVTTGTQPQAGSRGLPRISKSGGSSVSPMPSPYGSDKRPPFVFAIQIEVDELDGGYVASVEGMLGCVSQGETINEAIENVLEVRAEILATARPWRREPVTPESRAKAERMLERLRGTEHTWRPKK